MPRFLIQRFKHWGIEKSKKRPKGPLRKDHGSTGARSFLFHSKYNVCKEITFLELDIKFEEGWLGTGIKVVNDCTRSQALIQKLPT